MVAPLVAAVLPSLVQGIMGLFGGGDNKSGGTVSQQPMQTKEQKEAIEMLLNIGKGEGGYTGELGTGNLTGTENIAQSKLAELVQAGMPKMTQLGQAEIEKLLTTEQYDPYSEKGVYKGMKRNIETEFGEATDEMKRAMNFSGGLYSTETGKNAMKLAEAKGNKLSDILAGLYQKFGEQKLAGATTAAQMGQQEQEMTLQQIQQGATIGSIPRLLEEQKAKEKYAEWTRARGEKLNALKTVADTTANYGIKDYPIAKQSSPFEDIINTALKNLGGSLGDYFSKSITPQTSAEKQYESAIS